MQFGYMRLLPWAQQIREVFQCEGYGSFFSRCCSHSPAAARLRPGTGGRCSGLGPATDCLSLSILASCEGVDEAALALARAYVDGMELAV